VQLAYEIEDDVTRYATVWEPDSELEIDNWRLDLEGANGILRHRYRVTLEDGEPITRTLEDSWMAQQPITRTYKYGTQIVMRELETADGPVSYWRKVRMFATSYSPANSGQSPDEYYYGLTRLGDVVQRGVVAVDPTVVSLRTNVYVPGYGFAKASDTGGGVKGRWIDLGFSDRDYQPWSRCGVVFLLGPPPPAYAIIFRLPVTPKTSCLTS
jgi:3D (Asp-Asp-Asp) domain-containing protein